MSPARALLVRLVSVAALAAIGAPALAQELTPGSFKAFAPSNAPVRISDFSGLPVPRYSSLKSGEVNGRAGPSTDYPVVWSYRRAGLPVVIVRESADWRKVRDPVGDEVWIHRSMLGSSRMVVAMQDGAIRREPAARAPVTATFAAGAVMSLGECRSEWCRVEADGRKGYALKRMLWGAEDLPQSASGG